MNVVYFALELKEDELIKSKDISNLIGTSEKNIKIQPMSSCKGNDRYFRWLTDLYLWTCKYWYGISEEKLTFIRIKGANNIHPFFMMKYSNQLRFSISADRISIFSKPMLIILKKASYESFLYFNRERINAIRPFIKNLETSYKILYLEKNPYKK